MINGHPMTEVIFDSNNYFGQDFGLEMDLVERIEIIRGPSSALYGSNGILANINVITKAPVDSAKFAVSTEVDSIGPQKLTLMSSVDLGKGANLLVEGSGFMGSGHDMSIPGYDTSDQNYGVAQHLDGQSGYHSYVDLAWGSWNFSGYFNTRLAQAAVLGDGATFNGPGQFYRDTRDFIGATYIHDYSNSSQLRWQIYYDHYGYADRYDQPPSPTAITDLDEDSADWVSSEVIYSHPLSFGELTMGLSANVEIRNLQENVAYSPVREIRLDFNRPDASIAPFLQQEWALAARWKAYFGVRLDESRQFGAFFHPASDWSISPRPGHLTSLSMAGRFATQATLRSTTPMGTHKSPILDCCRKRPTLSSLLSSTVSESLRI